MTWVLSFAAAVGLVMLALMLVGAVVVSVMDIEPRKRIER